MLTNLQLLVHAHVRRKPKTPLSPLFLTKGNLSQSPSTFCLEYHNIGIGPSLSNRYFGTSFFQSVPSSNKRLCTLRQLPSPLWNVFSSFRTAKETLRKVA
jgi:hypothetical protein